MLQRIFLYIFICLSIEFNICYAHVDSAKLLEECKIADICRHDQVPVCGIDSCGEMRTFIDTCDMHEFNCDSKKAQDLLSLAQTHLDVSWTKFWELSKSQIDFVQKPVHECWVTCKRGRSFKKSAYGAACDLQNIIK